MNETEWKRCLDTERNAWLAGVALGIIIGIIIGLFLGYALFVESIAL
ncbi:MAG: hypothetical protein WBC21_04025 [Minisyncoccales bacterium]